MSGLKTLHSQKLAGGDSDDDSFENQPNEADMVNFMGDRLITKRLVFDKVKSIAADTSSDDQHGYDDSDDSDYDSNEEFMVQRAKAAERAQKKVDKHQARKRAKRMSKAMKGVGTKRFRDLLQGSKNPIELIVPSRAIRWRNILYMFSRILVGFGLGIFVFGIWVAASPNDSRHRVLPHWTAMFIIPWGVFAFTFGVLAWRGSDVSIDKLRHGRRNLWLWSLNGLLLFLILFFLTAFILVFVLDIGFINNAFEQGLIKDVERIQAGDKKPGTNTDYEAERVGQPKDSKAVRQWYDIQQFLICCGWSKGTHVLGKGSDFEKVPKSHSLLATGKWCTSQEATTGQPCFDALAEYMANQGGVFLAVLGVFVCVQLTVLTASICLTYIIKAHTPFMNI